MKDFLRIMLLAIIVCCWSCSGGDDSSLTPTITPEEKPKIEITTIAPVLAQEGGTATVTFSSNTNWMIDVVEGRSVSWCTVSPTSGTKGTNTLTITTTGNDTYDERNAKVTIKAGETNQSFIVTQKQKDALIVTSNKVEIGAEGGHFSIEAKANVTINYEIEEVAKDWISSDESRALTTKTLNFTVKTNEKIERREGKITLKGENGLTEIVTIYQEGEKPTLVITSDDILLSSEGETIKIELKSNVDYTMILPDVDWISKADSRSMSTYTHYLFVAPNETYDQRNAVVFFHNETEGLKDSISIVQLQKDAIIVAKNEYTIAEEGGNLDFSVNTNVEFDVSVSVDWIKQNTSSRALMEKPLSFAVATNHSTESREGDIVITYQDLKQSIKVKQKGAIDYEAIDRAALIEFYKATGGDNWINNENWCSDKPISEWYGINTERFQIPNEEKRVVCIDLCNNNLVGELPKELGSLSNLKYLDITENYNLSGEIPKEIGNLSNLMHFNLGQNNLSGSIPKELWSLIKLEKLVLSGNNYFSGEIDPEIGNLTALVELHISDTDMSGEIPEEITNLTNLKYFTLANSKFSGNIPKNIGNMSSLVEIQLLNNQLTGKIPDGLSRIPNLKLIHVAGNNLSGSIPVDLCYCTALKELHLYYNQLSGNIPDEIENLSNLTYLNLGYNNLSGSIPQTIAKLCKLKELYLYSNQLTGDIPNGLVELQNLKTLGLHQNKLNGECSEELSSFIDNLDNYSLEQQNGYEITFKYYTSTDFSQDGKIITLQQHTKGPGIKFVITIDAFSDRQITDGTVDSYIQMAYETLFSVEPYTSFRDYFDVYAVLTVSKREKIFTDTALKTAGNEEKYALQYDLIEKYAKKIPAINNDISNTHILVILNHKSAMRANCGWTQYGSISCANLEMSDNMSNRFDRTIRHEILGHGFGRLGDEYVEGTAYPYNGSYPEELKQNVLQMHKEGFYLNVDITNDRKKIIWKDFLTNKDYSSEDIGIYEGALYYKMGAYRSTYSSIMRHNIGNFNAPSRWAIYKQIMEISGEPYSFDSFLEYDKKNLSITNSVSSRSESEEFIDKQKLGAPPIFISNR